MILASILSVLLFAVCCSAQAGVRPQIRKNIAINDDSLNWALLRRLTTKTELERTYDLKLSAFEAILRVNVKERNKANVERTDGKKLFLFEGDIEMDKTKALEIVNEDASGRTSRGKRAVMKKTSSNLWRRGISYAFDSRLSSRARSVIRSAVQEWERTLLPCLGTWTDVTSRGKPRDYMYFFPGGGCYSQVGRVGRAQRVSIGRGCEYHGIAVHEIGHAMGLWHEQSRPDRDKYVEILWNNIIPAMRFNFQKYSTSRINSLGERYDYGSVMHYGATAFARRRGLTTIRSIGQRKTLGQRQGLSKSDKKQVKLLYGCSTKVKPTKKPTVCRDSESHRNWCSESKKLGLCSNSLFKSYVMTYCCSTCQPPVTPKPAGCSRDTNKNCAFWAERGFCKKDSQHSTYMKTNCCKACKKFEVKKCVHIDKNKSCPSWKQYCNNKAYEQYMKKNCAKTCSCR